MTKTFKMMLVGLLAGVMVLGTVAGSFITATAATKKLARVKISSFKVNSAKTKATVKWKKAKGAKKYEVHLKKGSAKYKKVKTLKARKYTFKLKKGTKYAVKVRGIAGKKKGAFSKVKTVLVNKNGKVVIKTEAEKAVGGNSKNEGSSGNKMTVKLGNSNVTIEEGKTCTIPLNNGSRNIKVTSVYQDDGFVFVAGKTADGTPVSADIKDGKVIGYTVGEDLSNTLTDAEIQRLVTYWTIDGTEPKVGQQDKYYDGLRRWVGGCLKSEWDGKGEIVSEFESWDGTHLNLRWPTKRADNPEPERKRTDGSSYWWSPLGDLKTRGTSSYAKEGWVYFDEMIYCSPDVEDIPIITDIHTGWKKTYLDGKLVYEMYDSNIFREHRRELGLIS